MVARRRKSCAPPLTVSAVKTASINAERYMVHPCTGICTWGANVGRERCALLLFGRPFERPAATAALRFRLKLDLVTVDLAGIVQLHFLIAELPGDGESHRIAFHLAVRDGGLAHHAAGGLAGDLVAFLLEGEGALDRAVS